MKTCPSCNRNYPDDYGFCLDDGSTLSAPLGGEKTELRLNAPYAASGTGSTTMAQVPADAAGTTVASPLPTIETIRRRDYATSDEPERRRGILLWIAAAVVLLLVTGGGGWYLLSTERSNANDQVRAPGAPSTLGAVASPTPSPNAPLPGEIALEAVVATGRTEAEIVEEPLVAPGYFTTAYINTWKVKKGDVLNPCVSGSLARFNYYARVDMVDAPPAETQFSDDLRWDAPVVVVRLDVREKETFNRGQRLAVLGKIVDMWLAARTDLMNAARIPRGAKAFFTESQSKHVFNGTVESVDSATGDIRVKLDNSEVFGKNDPNCLVLYPDRTGEVRFSVSNIPPAGN